MYVNSSYIEIAFVDYRETTREDTMSRMLLLLPLVTEQLLLLSQGRLSVLRMQLAPIRSFQIVH